MIDAIVCRDKVYRTPVALLNIFSKERTGDKISYFCSRAEFNLVVDGLNDMVNAGCCNSFIGIRHGSVRWLSEVRESIDAWRAMNPPPRTSAMDADVLKGSVQAERCEYAG